jgi:hypothetical protein
MLPGIRRLACPALLATALAACAGPGTDWHLAPLYTRTHTADGGVVVEALGGLYRQHRRADGFLEWRTLPILYGTERERSGDFVAHALFPLGYTRSTGAETLSYLLPVYVWSKKPGAERPRTFLLCLPGISAQNPGRGETHWGWFPFYGSFEDFLTFDRARYVLWPLYLDNDRSGRISHHLIWPILGWTKGGGESSWHFFPLVGRARLAGRYDRTYVLWPIYHRQENHLGGGGEEPESVWMVWPLFGRKQRGSYDAYTSLWPLLGYSRDTRGTGFWALDCPWPLVRLQRGPGEAERTRFWPLYSHSSFVLEGLEAESYLWPIVHLRHEVSTVAERDSIYVVPFWQSWDRLDRLSGETSSWRKLWPLFSHERVGDWRQGAVFELDFFWKNRLVPRYLTGIFHLYDWEQAEDFRRERSLLGLYRRELGRGEDRRSLAGLWARRSYEEDGVRVRETALFFGLLRWRVTEERGFDMLPPAFPGPGWPAPRGPGPVRESRSYF